VSVLSVSSVQVAAAWQVSVSASDCGVRAPRFKDVRRILVVEVNAPLPHEEKKILKI